MYENYDYIVNISTTFTVSLGDQGITLKGFISSMNFRLSSIFDYYGLLYLTSGYSLHVGVIIVLLMLLLELHHVVTRVHGVVPSRSLLHRVVLDLLVKRVQTIHGCGIRHRNQHVAPLAGTATDLGANTKVSLARSWELLLDTLRLA